jgi:hexosaminidase
MGDRKQGRWCWNVPAAAATLLSGCLLVRVVSAEAPREAPIGLRWEAGAAAPGVHVGGAPARFTITNTSDHPLPRRGWTLYFTCAAGVESGAAPGGFVFEQIAGTYYGMRPAAGFDGLAPGQSAVAPFALSGAAQNAAQLPLGPYFAFDDAPESAVAISDYQLAPLPAAAGSRSPEQTYQRNAMITMVPAESRAPVLPTPRSYQRRHGELRWDTPPQIVAAPALDAEAQAARAMLAPFFAGRERRPRGVARPAVRLRLAIARLQGSASPEAYELELDPLLGVSVRGNSATGVARGLESLRQLLPASPAARGPVLLPALLISDAPRFAYRGLMLDVARNFQPKPAVLHVLDLMARFKLNVFHFHLTDDEGWRLEIPGLPELTSVGARRGHPGAAGEHLPPAYGSGPYVSNPFGSGYYSRADYIEILRYAASRHIDVIPEIEMPGHARAAVVAMAERARHLARAGRPAAEEYLLGDRADHSVYLSAQLYSDNVMNPGLPSTYAFVARVIGEVAAMHRAAGVPLRTIHVGGDELPAGAWEHSPACAELMRREHLASRDEVWEYFYTRIERLLRRQGIAASGWEELGTLQQRRDGAWQSLPNPHLLGRGYTLYVWRNIEGAEDLAYRLANAGYDAVLTPATRMYLDLTPYPDPGEAGQTWAGHVDLDTVFDFIPFDDNRVAPDNPTRLPDTASLGAAGRRHIRGIEATLFGETLNESSRLDYMLMPRLVALAERAWAPDPAWATEPDPARAAQLHAVAWSQFVSQLGYQVLPRLDAGQSGAAYRIPAPGLKRVAGAVLVNQQIPGLVMRYTANGAVPTVTSPEVVGPIVAPGLIRVAAFDRNGRAGRDSQIDNNAMGAEGR